MTAAEACRLLVTTLRDLSEARDERDSYRFVAQMAIHALHDQHAELERLRSRYHALLEERRRPAA